MTPPAPPPYKPDPDAIRWIEDPWHGPSRPRRPACWLIFWRSCSHRVLKPSQDRNGGDGAHPA